jgi:hypothetical protein
MTYKEISRNTTENKIQQNIIMITADGKRSVYYRGELFKKLSILSHNRKYSNYYNSLWRNLKNLDIQIIN